MSEQTPRAAKCPRCSSLESAPGACAVCKAAQALTRTERRALRHPADASAMIVRRMAKRGWFSVEYVADGCSDYVATRTTLGDRVLASLRPGRPPTLADGEQRTIWLDAATFEKLDLIAEQTGRGWYDVARGILATALEGGS